MTDSSPRICFLLLDHRGDEYFRDLVASIRACCPADIAWYDAGDIGPNEYTADVPRLAASRPLAYAKEAPFFLDAFEWAAGEGYDYLVNVETDMAFVGGGFERFLDTTMDGLDYLAPRLELKTPKTSRWRPYRSLRGELPELLGMLDIGHTNAAFNPGQVFTKRFVETVLDAPFYGRLRDFVERNQQDGKSFSLPEVLMPTMAEALGLGFAGYPDRYLACNRYRPYHALASVRRAAADESVHFVHPVRRDPAHPARRFVRSLTASAAA